MKPKPVAESWGLVTSREISVSELLDLAKKRQGHTNPVPALVAAAELQLKAAVAERVIPAEVHEVAHYAANLEEAMTPDSRLAVQELLDLID